MTSQELFTFMRDWIISTIPTANVVETNPSAPPPVDSGTYFTIEEDGLWRKIGSRSVRDTDGVQRTVISDYEVKFVIWEVHGHGENLRVLLDDLDTFTTRILFSSAGIAVMRPATIYKVPTIIDKAFTTMAHRCELTLGIPRATTENVTSVEGVGISGTVTSINGDLVVDIQVNNP